MEGCILTGGRQRGCAGTLNGFHPLHPIPQEMHGWLFEMNMLSVRYGGEVVLDKPLSQREEYLRQMKVLFFGYELWNCY